MPPSRDRREVPGHEVELVERLRAALQSATCARKCHACGCFQDAAVVLEGSALSVDLADVLAEARATFRDREYDCIGCEICWPADALNIAADLVELPVSAVCSTDAPARRAGWPPMPGEFEVLSFSAPVAVCTLHDLELVGAMFAARPAGLSIVGAMQTENLGVERLIENVVTNPHLRVVVLCGEDTAGRVGHFPGQTLLALVEHGVDADRRVRGARGRRPVLKNVDTALIEHFREQVRILDHRGEQDVSVLASLVERAAEEAPGPMERAAPVGVTVPRVPASPPGRLVLDPKGYVVVTPDRHRGVLVVEHYEDRGVLTTLVEGERAVDVMATLLARELLSRLDHAAYVGRELALAERALRDGTPYVQDRAPEPPPEEIETAGGAGCCTSPCGAS